MLYSIIGILVIILDQLVKYWVDKNINWTHPTIELIPKVLSLVRVQNDGAAFSFLSGGSARIWFIVLTAVFALLVVLALATNFVSGRFGRWCLVLITAGGLSNMIDRVRFGYVIDMFKFELFDFAVFNVADIFIAVFCIAFILYILFGGEKLREPDADEFDEDDYEEEIRPRRTRPVAARTKTEDDEEEIQPDRTRRKAKAVTAEKGTKEDSPENPQPPRKQRAQRIDAPQGTSRKSPSAGPQPAARRSGDPASRQPSSQSRTRSVSSQDAARQPQKPRPRVAVKEPDQEVSSARVKTAAQTDAMFEEMFAPKQPVQNAQQKASADAPALRTSAPAGSASSAPSQAKKTARPAAQKADADPFEEWEQANARVKAGAKTAYRQAAEAAAKTTSDAVSASNDAFSEFLAASAPSVEKKSVKKSVKPVPAEAPKSDVRPSAPPKKVTAPSDEFDLDSILKEFK